MLRRAMIFTQHWMIETGRTARDSVVRRIGERLASLPAPPESTSPRIQNMWGTADAWASIALQTEWENPDAGTKGRPSCQGSGCWGCCRGVVSVDPEEVPEIIKHLTEDQKDKVLEAKPSTIDKAELCPLLAEDKSCSIYAVRPTVCRVYMTITPRDDCFPEITGPGRKVATPTNRPLLELLETVILNEDDRGFVAIMQDAIQAERA